MDKGVLYFFTATALYWQRLLEKDEHKIVLIDSLRHLKDKGMITVYAFVIMPNHFHLLVEICEESPQNFNFRHSLLSYTAHEIRKLMMNSSDKSIERYRVNAKDRAYQFWERNSKAIKVSDYNGAGGIVNYIHTNPLQEQWNLAVLPEKYKWSSAGFYENLIHSYDFLSHYVMYFDRKPKL